MKQQNTGLLVGVLIVLVGLLALLRNLEIIHSAEEIIGGIFFLLVGYLFYTIYRKDPSRWGAILPAIFFTLLGILFIFKSFFYIPDAIVGAIILWCGSFLFGYLYARNPQRWWPVIPAGLLFTLGTIVIIDAYHLLDAGLNGVVFFLGLGLSFVYLYMQRTPENNLDWAKWPGGVLLFFALFIYVQSLPSWRDDLLLPVILLLMGGYLIIRATMAGRRTGEK